MRVVAFAGVALLVSTPLFAQDPIAAAQQKQQQDQVKSSMQNLEKQLKENQARVPIENPIKGAPYSADVIIETSQTLGDGNHIANQQAGKVYRDSEGRTRREQSGAMTSIGPTEPVITTKQTVISITDPVAGFSYSLDTEHKIAWRTPLVTADTIRSDEAMLMKKEAEARRLAQIKEQAAASGGLGASEPAGAATAGAGGRGGKEGVGSAGPLQNKTIDGIAVEGRVNTKVIPAGAIGNDLPITVTSEEWRSPDLQVLVMTRHSDPRTGDSTYRLANIVRGDPDPSLFSVPSDYTVQDTGIRRENQR